MFGLDNFPKEWQLDTLLSFILVGTDEQKNTPNDFPVEHISASVGWVVAVIILVTFLFLMKRIWCKKGNSNPDFGVSPVFCNQQLTSLISDDFVQTIWRVRLWDYFSAESNFKHRSYLQYYDHLYSYCARFYVVLNTLKLKNKMIFFCCSRYLTTRRD